MNEIRSQRNYETNKLPRFSTTSNLQDNKTTTNTNDIKSGMIKTKLAEARAPADVNNRQKSIYSSGNSHHSAMKIILHSYKILLLYIQLRTEHLCN